MNHIINFLKDEEGASAVEYGLLVAAVAAIIIVLVFTMGRYVQAAFQAVVNAFVSDGSITT